MLRTRRRDNNVKPNRREFGFKTRLDRKSSRGMLYENEELRLKTININAEIERGQSDIKKLKRENEMLKKEIWCLRDEYDKLDKMLKDKKIDFSSSSTTYSSSDDSESCSSCTEDTEEVETSQNLKNVQKTNLKNIKDQFDHLSIVTEETSCENSDEKSNRISLPNDPTNNLMAWNNYESNDIIKADQSYPIYANIVDNLARSQTVPNQMENYFSPIKTSKSFDDFSHVQTDQNTLFPCEFYESPMTCQTKNPIDSISDHMATPPPLAISPNTPAFEQDRPFFPTEDHFLSKKIVRTNANNFYQNMILVPKNPNQITPEVQSMDKRATDLIVKIDNKNFNSNTGLTYSNTTPSTTFSNGGNLEQLLHDIESISQRGIQAIPESHHDEFYHENQNFYDFPHDSNPGRMEGNLGHHYSNVGQLDNLAHMDSNVGLADDNPRRVNGNQGLLDSNVRPGSGNLGRSNGSVRNSEGRTESEEKLHKSELNVVLMPKAMPLIGFDKYKNIQRSFESLNSKHLDHLSVSQQNLAIIPPHTQRNSALSEIPSTTPLLPTENQESNPFFFGNFTDNYVPGEYFNKRYIPEGLERQEQQGKLGKPDRKTSITPNQHPENEENPKIRNSKISDDKEKLTKKEESPTKTKAPKMSITKKVSIHFKGKKEKAKLKKAAQDKLDAKLNSTKKLGEEGKKSSLFDIRFGSDPNKDKSTQKEPTTPNLNSKKSTEKSKHQKTPSLESKKSTTETSNFDPKTPTGTSTDSTSEKKNMEKGGDKKGMAEGEKRKEGDKKSRKSSSVSPDRTKHVHVIHDVGYPKKHKKHRNKDRSGRPRRASIDQRLRERSFSICTDRSALESRLALGLGMGLGGLMYDEYSDRERTNSGSSMDSNNSPGRVQRRRLSVTGVPMNGKVPWCGCWGNGCV